MAMAANAGGATGIRANGPEDIRAIKKQVALPVIGIYKIHYPGSEVYITPTLKEALAVADAGAEIVALDGTQRERPDGHTFSGLVSALKSARNVLVMADVSTLEEGIAAARAGADVVASTLSGYTPYSRRSSGPDLHLVRELASKLDVPVIAEGHITTPSQACDALAQGAHAIVVGHAITDPIFITKRFVAAIEQ